MNRVSRIGLLFTTLIGLATSVADVAKAQQYPSRAISIVTPAAAGSPFDLLGRIFADRLRQKLGVPVVLENVTGGQGLIATHRVLSARSDGYTLLIATTGLTSSPLVVKNAGYKAEDFVAVAPLGQAPYLLFVNSSVPANDIDSFLSYLKSNAKSMNSGVLTASHLSMLLSRKFGEIAGGGLTEIGYRGSADQMRAILANEIQMVATAHSVAAPHLAAGTIKAIGVTADQRTHKMPDLPTFKEKGHPSLTINIWECLFAKSDLPADILARIRAASREIVSDPGYLAAMESTGMEPWTVPFEQLQNVVDEDANAFKRDAEKYGLRPE